MIENNKNIEIVGLTCDCCGRKALYQVDKEILCKLCMLEAVEDFEKRVRRIWE